LDVCRYFSFLFCFSFFFFFFISTAPTEIYTLSLHDALPISPQRGGFHFKGAGVVLGDAVVQGTHVVQQQIGVERHGLLIERRHRDRKSTRLNSSHLVISYAVFCLKKKKKKNKTKKYIK